MTTLYKTPDVIIDGFEWHILVHIPSASPGRKPITTHYWRPLSARRIRWRSISSWQGFRPKGLGDRFWRYRCHIREALEGRAVRDAALARLERARPNGAMLRNAA